MDFSHRLKTNLFYFLSRWVAPQLLKTIRWTSSVKVSNRDNLSKLFPAKNFILAFWHGQMLPLVQFFLNSGFYTFVSPHRDGEYVSGMMKGMGQNALRTSLRDVKISALVEGLRLARQGETLAITPDGPIGPRLTAKPGIIKISQRTELPILPAAGLATKARYFSSWDRFCFPLPFGKIMLNFGAPFSPAEISEPVDDLTGELENKLSSLTEELAEECELPPDYFSPLDS